MNNQPLPMARKGFIYMSVYAPMGLKDDHDVIHFDNSSDLALSTSLDDLDFATLNIDGQSIDVDAPPDIIDVEEDDDLINDEDALPHDLADSNDEDLTNNDDDEQGNPKTQLGRQESRQTRYSRANQEPRVKEDYRSIGPTEDPV
ncbi:hypothetical protein Tco_1305737 [Tanacetum coccineum]